MKTMNMQQQNLYWLGNSAKTKIIRDILQKTQNDQEVIIFDYGCGSGGDWPSILANHPNIKLFGYEPSQKSFELAKQRLGSFDAQLMTGESIDQLPCKADFIVSFSVLEHVYDKSHYLSTAKKYLNNNGLFYLNYDDGHFRNYLDLNQPNLWWYEIKEWIRNLLAQPLASVGKYSLFQQRVECRTIDELVNKFGFSAVEIFYSNLRSFKSLCKTLPKDKQEDFSIMWLEVEDTLNTKFSLEGTIYLGDPTNIWSEMGSRTLVLRHSN